MSPLALLPLLLLLAACQPPAAAGQQPKPQLSISGSYRAYRNDTGQRVVEIEYSPFRKWTFQCSWSRDAAAGAVPLLAMSVPQPPGSLRVNCEFGKDTCTPSRVTFPAVAGYHAAAEHAIACSESESDLVCGIDVDSVNQHHIGAWSCLDVRAGLEDSVRLLYFKELQEDELQLVATSNGVANATNSSDPGDSSSSSSSSSSSRFDCFTTAKVIPPARLRLLLGGVQLGVGDPRHSDVELSDEIFVSEALQLANLSSAAAGPMPGLQLQQQLLATHRWLRLQQPHSLGGLVLTCVADQGLWPRRRRVAKEIVLGNSAIGEQPTATVVASTLALLAAASLC